jgi:hypothetical protein
VCLQRKDLIIGKNITSPVKRQEIPWIRDFTAKPMSCRDCFQWLGDECRASARPAAVNVGLRADLPWNAITDLLRKRESFVTDPLIASLINCLKRLDDRCRPGFSPTKSHQCWTEVRLTLERNHGFISETGIVCHRHLFENKKMPAYFRAGVALPMGGGFVVISLVPNRVPRTGEYRTAMALEFLCQTVTELAAAFSSSRCPIHDVAVDAETRRPAILVTMACMQSLLLPKAPLQPGIVGLTALCAHKS